MKAIMCLCSLVTWATAAQACMLIGDSITEGTARYLPECASKARSGLTSAQILERTRHEKGPVAISAGSNDPRNPELEANLRGIRQRISGQPVVWVLPMMPEARRKVQSVADDNGDLTVGFAPREDWTHPASYAELAAALRTTMALAARPRD